MCESLSGSTLKDVMAVQVKDLIQGRVGKKTAVQAKFLVLWVKFSADEVLKYISYFPRKQVLTFHANCLQWRQFAWNVKFSLFVWEK